MTFHDPKPVRQCCCYPLSFAEIWRQAQENDWQTGDAIGKALGCGTGCGLCRPYLARMLQTGETAFAVMEKPDTACDIPSHEKK